MATSQPAIEKKYVKLLPGEDILLRDESCLLAGALNSEATGVLFMTNFRVLFSGLFTQEPDEHDLSHANPHTDPLSAPAPAGNLVEDLAQKPDSASPLIAQRRSMSRHNMRPRGENVNSSFKRVLMSRSAHDTPSEPSWYVSAGNTAVANTSKSTSSLSGGSRFYVHDASNVEQKPETPTLSSEPELSEPRERQKTRGLSCDFEVIDPNEVGLNRASLASEFEVVSQEGELVSQSRCVNHITTEGNEAAAREEACERSSANSPTRSEMTRSRSLATWSEDSEVAITETSPSVPEAAATAACPDEQSSVPTQLERCPSGSASTDEQLSDPERHSSSASKVSTSSEDGSSTKTSNLSQEETARISSSSLQFAIRPSDSVIDTTVPTDHALQVSMPVYGICKMAAVQLQTMKFAPRSRQSMKLTVDGLEITMHTGQVYKIAMMGAHSLTVLQSLVKDLRSRMAHSGNHFAQLHAQAVQTSFPGSVRSSSPTTPVDRRSRDVRRSLSLCSFASEVATAVQVAANDCYDVEAEADRLHIIKDAVWKLLSSQAICPTYPSTVIVPVCTPDVDLARLAPVHQMKRFPVVSWIDSSGAVLLRASSPVHPLGDHITRSPIHEGMFRAICTLSSTAAGRDEQLHVFLETSPAKKQQAAKGTLNPKMNFYYPGCKFLYHDAFSLHAVRKSFKSLRSFLHRTSVYAAKYFSALEETHWLQQLSTLLQISCNAVQAIDEDKVSVLIAFEGGWDATSQIVSLVQLMLDPYFRTYAGFQVLIRKEWISFSHHFAERNYPSGQQHGPKVDAPIFLQWLDCVWQLLQQFPMAFEFNESLLEFLAVESYSARFGTFLRNGLGDGSTTFFEGTFLKNTLSIWTFLDDMENKASFITDYYLPEFSPQVLLPVCHVPSLKVWSRFYLHPFIRPDILQHEATAAEAKSKLVNAYKAALAQAQFLARQCTEKGLPSGGVSDSFDASAGPHIFGRSTSAGAGSMDRMLASPQVQLRRRRSRTDVSGVKQARPVSMSMLLNSSGIFNNINLAQFVKDKGLVLEAEIRVNKRSCCGYMEKSGVGLRKGKKKRWFVLDLDKQYLTYFTDEASLSTGRQPAGVVSLSDVTKVYQQEKKEMLLHHIFFMETRHGQRTFTLQAPTRGCLLVWSACLQHIVEVNESRSNTH